MSVAANMLSPGRIITDFKFLGLVFAWYGNLMIDVLLNFLHFYVCVFFFRPQILAAKMQVTVVLDDPAGNSYLQVKVTKK